MKQVDQYNEVEIMFENETRKMINYQTIPNNEAIQSRITIQNEDSSLCRSQNMYELYLLIS